MNHNSNSENNSEEATNSHISNKENQVNPNLFQGRPESVKGNAKFPDWDVVPPNQFINPRVKPQQ